MFYVNQCLNRSSVAVQGFSITEYSIGSVNGTTTAAQTGDANNVFISERHAAFRVLAHELGHVLTKEGHYGDDFDSHDYVSSASDEKKKHNLMSNSGNRHETDQIGASKHLFEMQREMIWDHNTLAK